MKFKKSISFVLTLCMVLSLFATFVIPVAAEGATSQVVENWNVANWNDGVNTSNAAYIFTDASVYSSATAFAWWRHVAFAPTATEGVYEVTEIAVGTGGEGGGLTVPENGFVWVAFEWPESGSGVYALNVMNTVVVGDKVAFTGIDVANCTTTEDATAEKVVEEPVADPDAPVSVALGKTYTYPTSGLYFHWSEDWPCTDNVATALTDGEKVAGYYGMGTTSGWGGASPNPLEVVIDLEAVYSIDSFAYTVCGGVDGISMPESVAIYVSEDGENFTAVDVTIVDGELTSPVSWTTCADRTSVATASAAVEGRYVKFAFTKTGNFVFINELEVFGTKAPEAGLAGENVSRWEAGAEFAVLTDGDNGVGEVNNYNPFQPRLFGVASGVMEATDYTLTFAIDKAEFNTITLYALDFANGGVMLPEAVTFVVNGVKYEAAINANANGIATIVATLDEAVTASRVVAEVTMGASPYSFTIFNMFTEFEVSNKLPEEATGLDYFGYTHTTLNYVMYVDADMTLGDLTAKYFGSSKDLNYFKVIVVNEDGTVAATYTTLGRPDGVKSDFAVTAGQVVLALSANEVNVGRFEIVDTVNVGDIVTLYNVDFSAEPGELANAGFTVEAAPVVDDESFKETHTHADGDEVGTIQQLGADWEGKPSSCFWYLVDSAKDTVTVSVVVDDRKVVEGDTQLRIWIETDKDYTKRTTLVDVKVNGGKAEVVRCDNDLGAAVLSATYKVVGNDYYLEVVLDKATLGITGEYGLNITLSQTGSTTMHSIKYDNVTGEGVTYAPWTTTEFYEIFDKAPTTSQVVENFNHADWNTGINTFHAAYIFTDAEIYAGVGMAWWYHAAFAPVANGAYVVTEVAAPGSDAATNNTLVIPEGGFVWVAWTSSESGNGKSSGAYAKALMSTLKAGDIVVFNGLDIANLTTTEDASAAKLVPAADMDLLVSHNYNYSWHCFETQIISGLVPDAPKTAGDAPFLKDSVLDADILYIVENVNGAYLVTGMVAGKAIPETAIPEGGFLYYITANCTNYEALCHGELIGKYLVLGEIDLATTFAIDTQQGNPAKVMQAVSGFKTGDADLDGKITATDYAIIRKLVLGTLTAEDVGELVLKTADVNGNGKVDARDYYLAKRAFLGTYVIPGWEVEDAE